MKVLSGALARAITFALALLLYSLAGAQPSKVQRVGVILPGGAWHETIRGLRDGLRDLSLHEGSQFSLTVRETKGDVSATEEAAKAFEAEKVNLLYTTASSVTLAARRATKDIPIVFCAGADPVALGLVESFAKPGGRLTGVFYRDSDLISKRLEILKEIVPKLHRVLTFYNPYSPVSVESAKLVRDETTRRQSIVFMEKHVGTVEELQAILRTLRMGEVDAIFEVTDAMVQTQDQLVIDAAAAKRFPTMFVNHSSVMKGGLASYSVSRYEIGRLSARYVQRLFASANPSDLPVQGVDKIELVINLKTAKQIGLSIPPNVLARADRVIR
jgi:putative tryptophan/tyrosine transport system substrate-binding protein